MNATPDMADIALAYASIGIPVFPVWPAMPRQKDSDDLVCGCFRLNCDSPAKHPIGRLAPHGVSDATTDAARVHHWWSCRPDANIGAATGSLVGIDIDPRHGGTPATLGSLPATWRAATGGGGTHLFFRATSEVRNSAGLLAPGIDIRGAGGYVVLPPSLHISGRRYAWEADPRDTPLALLPVPILQALGRQQAKATAANWRALSAGTVDEGARNQTIARFAGHLLCHYVDPCVTLELLLAWNATHCSPPLGADEVERTVNSIAGREMKRRSRR
jgi:hypothetical protein